MPPATEPPAAVASPREPFHWRRLDPWLIRFVALLFIANVALVVWLLARHLNVVQVDLAGHIASADATWRGLYHKYSDAHFLGYVHGLFYPPLEDFLLGGIDKLLGWRLGFPLYLALVWAGFLAAAWRLGKLFATPARIFFLLGFLWLVSAQRDGLAYQGLSIWDLGFTGLSSQVLGGIWFLLLITELLGPSPQQPRTPYLIAWMTLTLGSHIVMGMLGAIACTALLGVRRTTIKQLLVVGVCSGALTATFWMPFLAYRSYMTTATIAMPAPWQGAAIAGVVCVVALLRARGRAIAILTLLLIGVLTIAKRIQDGGTPLPPFHYYRLALPSLLLLLIATAFVISAPWSGKLGAVVRIGLVALVGGWLFHELPHPHAVDLTDYTFRPTSESANPPSWPTNAPYGRQWTIENRRAADFGMDSLAEVESAGAARAVKGLYWESSRNNTLLSSYLASLVSAPVVLEFLALNDLQCDVQECLMETFARNFNIRRIAYDRDFASTTMNPQKLQCMQGVDKRARFDHIAMREAGTIRDQQTTYSVFDLIPDNDAANLDVVEPLAASQLSAIERSNRRIMLAATLNDAVQSCVATSHASERVFVDPVELKRLATAVGVVADPPPALVIKFNTKGENIFSFDVQSEKPILFLIKLSYLPGLVLRDEHGIDIPLFESFPGIVGYGHGHLTLTYEKPPIVRVGELSSVLSLLLLLPLGLWRRRVRKNQVLAAPLDS